MPASVHIFGSQALTGNIRPAAKSTRVTQGRRRLAFNCRRSDDFNHPNVTAHGREGLAEMIAMAAAMRGTGSDETLLLSCEKKRKQGHAKV